MRSRPRTGRGRPRPGRAPSSPPCLPARTRRQSASRPVISGRHGWCTRNGREPMDQSIPPVAAIAAASATAHAPAAARIDPRIHSRYVRSRDRSRDSHESDASISFSSMSTFVHTCCTSSWSWSKSSSFSIDWAGLPVEGDQFGRHHRHRRTHRLDVELADGFTHRVVRGRGRQDFPGIAVVHHIVGARVEHGRHQRVLRHLPLVNDDLAALGELAQGRVAVGHLAVVLVQQVASSPTVRFLLSVSPSRIIAVPPGP